MDPVSAWDVPAGVPQGLRHPGTVLVEADDRDRLEDCVQLDDADLAIKLVVDIVRSAAPTEKMFGS